MIYVSKYKQDIFFFLFGIQKIKSNCYINVLKFFSIIFFWWKIYSFPVIFTYKRFSFCYSLQIFFYSFMILSNCCSTLRTFTIFLLIGFVAAFLFFIQSGDSIYDPRRFWLMTLIFIFKRFVIFIITYGRNKVICYCYLYFLCTRFVEIIYDVFKILTNFI